MSTFAFTVLPSEPTALAAGVPAGLTQGFSEIVKQVTPAVVNIAVTGGGEGGGRGRRSPLPPGPFGGPPGEEAPGVNSRLLRRCLRGMDALIKAPDPASFLIRTDLS